MVYYSEFPFMCAIQKCRLKVVMSLAVSLLSSRWHVKTKMFRIKIEVHEVGRFYDVHVIEIISYMQVVIVIWMKIPVMVVTVIQ
jgi:hypothetical protein